MVKPNLVDKLHEDSPELVKKVESVGTFLATIKAYKNYLYRTPSEEEAEVPSNRRIQWNKMISIFDKQPKLEENLDVIETTTRVGDKVVVVVSEKPYFDTIYNNTSSEKPKAWIGNVVKQEFKKQDKKGNLRKNGKIHRNISLENAKQLDEKSLKSLIDSEFTRQLYGDRARAPFDNNIERLKNSKKGKETIDISEPYQQTDFFCVDQVFTDMEKQAKELEHPSMISIQDKLWKTEVPGRKNDSGIGRYGLAELYSDSKPWQLALVGNDNRSPEEIFLQIQNLYEKHYNTIKKDVKAEDIELFILKKMEHNLTKEDEEEIESGFYRDGVLNLKLTEKGYAPSDKTLIFLSVFKDRSGVPLANVSFTHELQEKYLKNYELFTFGGSHSHSYDKFSQYHGCINLPPMYFFEMEQYFGEVAKTPFERQGFIDEWNESRRRIKEKQKEYAEYMAYAEDAKRNKK